MGDFVDFLVDFDNYYLIYLEENCELFSVIYLKLCDVGYIDICLVIQYFDLEKQMFFVDCFIKGICLKCGIVDQYGDNCEVCGVIYVLIELKDLKLVIFGVILVFKELLYYFFKLLDFEVMFK